MFEFLDINSDGLADGLDFLLTDTTVFPVEEERRPILIEIDTQENS